MANKQLILLRHAKSDWHSSAQSDHARPLNHRGRKDAPKVGRWLSENGYEPERIVSSTANRTRETLQLAYDATDWGKIATDINIDFDDALYLASESTIVDIITDNLSACDRLMIVGHNPGMDSVLLGYCPNVTVTLSHKLGNKLMTTATVAIVQFSGADLSDPVLLEFHRPAEME
ncbi:SixA phosphatase family protein [Candidatus Spongiihabitans sp.]|uniref:SixA phosphatase family protein n=1 Tax=Candidatus Spongiihabitans sp. TaxID=3101308 RepID=UPI003C6EB799